MWNVYIDGDTLSMSVHYYLPHFSWVRPELSPNYGPRAANEFWPAAKRAVTDLKILCRRLKSTLKIGTSDIEPPQFDKTLFQYPRVFNTCTKKKKKWYVFIYCVLARPELFTWPSIKNKFGGLCDGDHRSMYVVWKFQVCFSIFKK